MTSADLTTSDRPASPLERVLAAACIAVLVAMNVALISWKIGGVPVRGMVASGLLGAVLLLYPERLVQAITRFAPVLWLAAGLALLGLVVSTANGHSLGRVAGMIGEIHIQIAITLLIAAVLADIAGMKVSALTFAGVVGGSVLIGLFQFIDIGASWSLRETLGRFQGEATHLNTSILNGRPLGLAFSPIQFSTHACLAFAVFAAAREQESTGAGGKPNADLIILFALGALCVAGFVSGTRSVILGAGIFFLIYALRRGGAWLAAMIGLGSLALYLIGPMLLDAFQTAQPRILRTDDNSATGRSSLFAMGLLLFADNPLGYGLPFNAQLHWSKFWQELYTMGNPSVIKDSELHNYLLNMLNTYGIGLLLTAPLAYHLLRRGQHVILFFVPYIVHILFHNSGPFWNDTLFWFTVAALAAPILYRGRAFGAGRHAIEANGSEAGGYRYMPR